MSAFFDALSNYAVSIASIKSAGTVEHNPAYCITAYGLTLRVNSDAAFARFLEYNIYTRCGKKVSPKITCRFLSNRLEFQR